MEQKSFQNPYCEKVGVRGEGVRVDVLQAFGDRRVVVTAVALQPGPDEETVGEGQREPRLDFVGQLTTS